MLEPVETRNGLEDRGVGALTNGRVVRCDMDTRLDPEQYLGVARYWCSRLRLERGYADDIVQGALLRLLRVQGQGGRIENMTAWLVVALRREALDLWRRESRMVEARDSSAVDFAEAFGAASVGDPRQHAEDREVTDLLHRAVNAMRSPFREILIQRLRDGRSCRDVSELLRSWRRVGLDECKRLIAIARIEPILSDEGVVLGWRTPSACSYCKVTAWEVAVRPTSLPTQW